MKKTYKISVIITQEDSDDADDWSMTVESDKPLTTYELSKIASRAARDALNKVDGVTCWGLTH